MLQKKVLAGRKVEVTFRMPPLDDVVELYLCGDFNGWQAKGVPLSQESDGTWVAALVLDAGKSYRFRYYDNQGRWHNDEEADAFVANDFGSEDGVLDLTGEAKESSKSRPPNRSATSTKAVRKGKRRNS
jgi:1,4-alpha-glucan branching enzyme